MIPEETIISLRANVSRDQAVHEFANRGLRRWRVVPQRNPLRSVADLYVPFRLFRAHIKHRNTNDARMLAMDLFSGALDPFTFDSVPDHARLVSINSRNRLECALSPHQVENALITKLQRILFQHGFFKVSGLTIRLETVMEVLYMPYWVGLFGSGDRVSIEVLDATRRVFEGNKFRAGVQEWLCD